MMDWRKFDDYLRPLSGIWSAGAAVTVLLAGFGAAHWIDRQAAAAREELFLQTQALQRQYGAKEYFEMFRDLKTHDLEQLKVGFSSAAVTNKALFESGLSLQEERRLLEKQWDIMTTYLMVNPALQRVFLMRGEEPLGSFLIRYIPPRYFGGDAPAPLGGAARIVSKERFAHPERGRSEVIDGTLQWIPPQVGTSVRSRALGEFVMFTNTPLILHGPSVDEAVHEQFPHWCIGLDLPAARRLYRASFIGTRILLKTDSRADES